MPFRVMRNGFSVSNAAPIENHTTSTYSFWKDSVSRLPHIDVRLMLSFRPL